MTTPHIVRLDEDEHSIYDHQRRVVLLMSDRINALAIWIIECFREIQTSLPTPVLALQILLLTIFFVGLLLASPTRLATGRHRKTQ